MKKIHIDTKFAYRHKPTGKWVYIEIFTPGKKDGKPLYPNIVNACLMDDFDPSILYSAKNIIEEDFYKACLFLNNTVICGYIKDNFLEFELVKIEIEYKLANDQ